MKQYNPGKWVGVLFMQSQFTSSYMTYINFAMQAGSLWVLASLPIKQIIPFATFWLFILALLMAAILVGTFHYVFVQRPLIMFQNEQACKHDNPVIVLLEEIKSHQLTIDKRLEAIEKKRSE